MAQIVSRQAAQAGRREVVANGVPAAITTYIGSNWMTRGPDAPPPPGPEVVYPMAFLVEQSAETVVQAHFHQANQWQVVVGGGGMLGRHAVEPVAVHYTNAFSSYGPLTAGPRGLHYFTLRNGYDPAPATCPARASRSATPAANSARPARMPARPAPGHRARRCWSPRPRTAWAPGAIGWRPASASPARTRRAAWASSGW
jgi:hypothetical protein